MTEYCYSLQQWNGGASAADSPNLQPWLHQGSIKWAESNGLSQLLLPACLGLYTRVSPAPPTCVYASVVLQISSSGELLATVLLLADERLLAVVRPHVNLQPLQHVEALPAALCAAPEHSVVPGSRDNQTSKPRCLCFICKRPTTMSDRATKNRFATLMMRELLQYKYTLLSESQLRFSRLAALSASTTNNLWQTLRDHSSEL